MDKFIFKEKNTTYQKIIEKANTPKTPTPSTLYDTGHCPRMVTASTS